jgi:hypothetical protein
MSSYAMPPLLQYKDIIPGILVFSKSLSMVEALLGESRVMSCRKKRNAA